MRQGPICWYEPPPARISPHRLSVSASNILHRPIKSTNALFPSHLAGLMCGAGFRILVVMAQLSVRLKRSLDSLAELHAATADFSMRTALFTLTANELAVVVEELFVNAVRHSTGLRGDIEVHLSDTEDGLSVQLIDMQVDECDITKLVLTDLDLPIEQRRPGGMGLHLVRQFADRFDYRYENGNGIITIEKNLRT